ncbi:vitamin-D-receptor interacting mediator subunit 4-domain-containing protein [Powellomyces hirtus]|nr:vitamin-D-receptor interacting mediator subunit 4-domain-containing protein [Powellomyces hirtus]
MTSIEEPAETLRKLVALDKQLRLFVDRLERHQKTQRQIEDAQMRVIDQEAGFMEMHRVLSEKHFECDELVHEASQMLEKARAARNDPLDVADITAYATRLAKYTMDSYTPDRLHEPPIPQEQHMRMSLLFQEGHSVGVTANMDGQAETGTPDHIPHFTFDADHSISPKKDEDAIVNHETLLDLDFEDFD